MGTFKHLNSLMSSGVCKMDHMGDFWMQGGARILSSIVAYKVWETEHRSPQLQPLPDLQLQS